MKRGNHQRSCIIRSSLALCVSMAFFNCAYGLVDGVQVNVMGGGSIVNFDKKGHVVFPTGSFRTDTFQNNSHKVNGTAAVGVAYNKIIGPNQYNKHYLFRDISLGVNVYYNQTSRDASVLEYGLTNFHNSNYNMKLKSTRLMLDTEWDIHPVYKVIPFIQGGVGVAQNKLQFKNKPLPDIGASGGNYNLPQNTKTQFAYEVGAGVKVPLTEHLLVSGRYLFANAGDAESSLYDSSTGTAIAQPIKTKVESQSVLFGLSYLFG